jgi:hypothetical protein
MSAHVPDQPGSPAPATATRSFHSRPTQHLLFRHSPDRTRREPWASPPPRSTKAALSFPLRPAPPPRQLHRAKVLIIRHPRPVPTMG